MNEKNEKNENCENCRFFRCGECHALPPAIITTSAEGPDWPARRQVGIWPVIDDPRDWCGAWARIKGEASPQE